MRKIIDSQVIIMSNETFQRGHHGSVIVPQPPTGNDGICLDSISATPPSTLPQIPTFPSGMVSDIMKDIVYEGLSQTISTQTNSPDSSGSRLPETCQRVSFQPQNDNSKKLQAQLQNDQTQNSIMSPPSDSLVVPTREREIKPLTNPISKTRPETPPATCVEMLDKAGRSLRKKRSAEFETVGEVQNGSNKREKKQVDPNSNRSRRFTWPDGMHRDFVSAIFDVGLKQATANAILPALPQTDSVSIESIKSYLEQYRFHRSKGREQFLTCHTASLARETEGVDRVATIGETTSPVATGHLSKLNSPQASVTTSHSTQQDEPESGALVLPILSEEEKRSPIGVSIGCLFGLFSSMRSQLMEQRARSAAHHSKSSASQAVSWCTPSLYVNSMHPGGYYADAFQDVKARAIVSASSTRADLTENSIMKHEMDNQRLFQNTMRALKQQELNKYSHPVNVKESEASENLLSLPNPVYGTANQEENNEISAMELENHIPTDDFWHTDVSDEQLFEFLMNPL